MFIELRELNQHPSVSLLTIIRSKLSDYIDGFSDQQLRYAIETGRIILFLDGFDEIYHDVRKEREQQINELAARYQNLWIFVSSRPAETFASWEKFFVFAVQPFTKPQVELLINNIPYDEEIKTIFRRKLVDGLYESHKAFLTNPLLTIMMLLTLAQFAEVPAKIHLFYEYAFEALFGRHDVTKGGFQRKRHTDLALDDFKRLFSYFCMITYLDEGITFSANVLFEKIQQSINSSQIDVDKTKFSSDLTESTCMLVMDGLEYTFSHRSFQEYFAAYFLCRVKIDEFERFIPKLVQRSSFDNVLNMVSEMNKEKFEEAWALPALNKLYNRVKSIDAKTNCITYVTKMLGMKPSLIITSGPAGNKPTFWLSIRGSEISSVRKKQKEDMSLIRHALYRSFGIFTKLETLMRNMQTKDGEIIGRIKRGELLAEDSRFEQLRRSKIDEPLQSIALKESDAEWLQETHIGKFVVAEGNLLPKLREEVERRVIARRKGIAAIFPSGA